MGDIVLYEGVPLRAIAGGPATWEHERAQTASVQQVEVAEVVHAERVACALCELDDMVECVRVSVGEGWCHNFDQILIHGGVRREARQGAVDGDRVVVLGHPLPEPEHPPVGGGKPTGGDMPRREGEYRSSRADEVL